MGKKRRPRKKPSAASNSNPISTAARRQQQQANTNTTTTPSSSLPIVLQRLRHADEAIREATIYGLSSQTTNRTLDYTVLQELRNQVSNHSVSAATCLIPHLHTERVASWWSTFHQVVSEMVEKVKNDKHFEDAAAGSSTVMAATTTKTKPNNHNNHNTEASLLLECLKCCTAMVENNPFVRHVEDAPEVFWEVLLLTYPLSSSPTSSPSEPATTTTTAKSTITNNNAIFAECCTYAARILHAMSEGASEPDTNIWIRRDGALLAQTQIMTMVDATVRGLHLLGTAINCRLDLSPYGGCAAIARALVSFDGMVSNPLLTDLCHVYEKHALARQDSKLEGQVIKTQQAKCEPARHIARRLRQKDQQGHKETTATTISDMQVDGDGNDGDDQQSQTKRSGKIPTDRPDTEAAWWRAVAEWEERLEPIELALEILTNLTLLLLNNNNNNNYASDDTIEQQLQQQRSEITITDDVVSSLEHLLSQLQRVSNLMLPADIQDSLTAVQNTAAVCAGNLLCTMASNAAPSAGQRIWTLVQRLSPPTAPILSAQMLVLKTHGSSYRFDDIQPYIALVESSTDEDVLREAIPLVSLVLTNGPQNDDAALIRTVAQALVRCPVSTGGVITERLNAIMDIYGADDECRASIFEEMKLSSYVQGQRKLLKERINVGSLGCSGRAGDIDAEEIASWKEAVENATAFIEYKQEQKNIAMEM